MCVFYLEPRWTAQHWRWMPFPGESDMPPVSCMRTKPANDVASAASMTHQRSIILHILFLYLGTEAHTSQRVVSDQ